MDSTGGISGMNTGVVPLSRMQEKEELQRLNDRFAAYVMRVRHLGQQYNNVDTTAFLRSTKILEDEITCLKNMYQMELDKLRDQIEASAYERNTLQAQCNKQQKYILELQDRLTVETDKSSRLLDDINILQRRIGNLESQVQDAHIAAQRPQEELDQLQKSVDSLSREADQWRHRCEQEQVVSQQCGERLQQVMKKAELSEQVQNQQIKDYQCRLDSASATIISLEARIQELSTGDASVSEMLKQVRNIADTELVKYQIESEDQYSRNLSALKAQIDCDGITIQRFSEEKSELVRSIGELQAKIRNLEGQIVNLQHQKVTLEDTVSVERNRAADNIRQLEKKLRDMQDMLVTKMFELTSAHESNIPLKAEIEALKLMLEEEERRLRVPLGTSSMLVSQPSASYPPSSALNSATSGHLQSNVVNNSVQSLADTRKAGTLEFNSPLHHDLYPYFSTMYIPETLHPGNESKIANDIDYDAGYDAGYSEYDLYRREVSLPGRPQYYYETSPSLSRLHVDPSFSTTHRPLGPIQSRGNSAPVKMIDSDLANTKRATEDKTKEKRWNYIPASFGQGRDYFEEMFYDLQKKSIFPKERPKSSPLERQIPSSFHDYTMSTFSSTGDLQILEVNQYGKYVRLVNDGPRELDIGGYMIRQNVDGHPVVVFKFPPNVNFPPNSSITVWSAINDPKLHNPPTDFLWKEQDKWGTGPESTTILCNSNGQAVAWTTAAHKYSKNATEETAKSKPQSDNVGNQVIEEDTKDYKTSTEQNVDSVEPKPESVNLKREKCQLPLLAKSKHSHGSTSAGIVHQKANQEQPAHLGLNGGSNSHHSKTKAVKGHKNTETPAQRVGGMILRMSGNYQQPHPPTIRGNGTLVKKQAGSINKSECYPYATSVQEHVINTVRDQAGALVQLEA